MRDGAEGKPSHPLELHRARCDGGENAGAEQAAEPSIGDDELEGTIGGFKKPLRHRDALRLVGVEQRRVGAALHHQRELPGEVVGILQACVHALRAGRAVNMRGVAEQETAAVAEVLGSAVRDAVGREPVAGLEAQIRSGLLLDRGHHLLEREVISPAKTLWQNANHSPAIFAAHREEEMKPVLPEIDVELAGLHRAGRLGVGDEERMLIGRAGEFDAAQLAHRAA